MLKINIEATAAQMRAAYAELAARPDMQEPFVQLQVRPEACDMAIAAFRWANTVGPVVTNEQVANALAIIIASHITTVLRRIDVREAMHFLLHAVLEHASAGCHASLGFSHAEDGSNEVQMPVVMKDVGDA